MRTTTKICVGCGTEYSLNYYERNRKQYCTQECAYKNRLNFDPELIDKVISLYRDERKSLSDVGMLVGLKYHNVGKILLDKNIPIRTNAMQQKINFEVDPNRHNGSVLRTICLQCGEGIVRWSSLVRYQNTFCSKECFDIYQTFRDILVRYGKGWTKARKLVRERDTECQLCGKTEKDNYRKLDVHHICPMRWFKEDKTKANDLDNLICLCPSCHTSVDIRVRKHERKYKQSLSNSGQQDDFKPIGQKSIEEVRNNITSST